MGVPTKILRIPWKHLVIVLSISNMEIILDRKLLDNFEKA